MNEIPQGPQADDAVKQPAELLTAQLSAFVDGELPEAESGLFVRQLLRDKTLQRSFGRYVLIGEAMRQPASVAKPRVSRDFSARVAAALAEDAQESTVPVSSLHNAMPSRLQSVWKNVAGLGVAAAVVASVWMGVQRDTGQEVDVAQTDVSRSGSDPGYVVPASASGPAAPIPATQLTNYVIAHSEYSTTLGRQNLMTGVLSEQAQSAEGAVWAGHSSSSVRH